jgi:glycerophosphoryl diester phosphodiesterase
VHVWTVDKPEVMQRMIERGVDNIITNEPALLKRVMRDRGALSAPERLALRLRVLFSKAPVELTSAQAVPQL